MTLYIKLFASKPSLWAVWQSGYVSGPSATIAPSALCSCVRKLLAPTAFADTSPTSPHAAAVAAVAATTSALL